MSRRPRGHLPVTAAAVTAAAALGAVGTDPDSAWYRALDKPAWQPPGPAFGAVWTPLYAALAWAGARALDRLGPAGRRRYALALGVNLALNAGWNWVFFRARDPRAAVGEIALLDVSTLDLLRRTSAADRHAGTALVPYALWTGFATALTVELARRNPAASAQR